MNLKRALNYALSFILTGVFLYIAVQNVDFGDVLRHISHADLLWVALLTLSYLLSHYIRALRWKVILNSVKPDTKMRYLFGSLMIGYGVNNVIPRLGEVTRAVLIAKWEGLSRSSMFGAVIVERVMDMIFLGLSILVSVFMWSGDLYTDFPWLKSTLIITWVIMGGVVLLLYLTIKLKEKFYGAIVKLLGRFSEKAAHKIGHIFEMLTEGFSSLKGTRNYVNAVILSIILMISYAFSSYLGFFTLGMQNIHPVNFEMGWVLMTISAIGVVIPTPGGTGSYHTLAKTTLVLLFGFAPDISLAYAFITHTISYFLAIISAVIIFFILNKQHESIIKIAETEVDEL